MWSIGGIHDQGWGERAVFGKIRYMNYQVQLHIFRSLRNCRDPNLSSWRGIVQGCQRKFDVKKFVSKYAPAAKNAAAASGQSTIF